MPEEPKSPDAIRIKKICDELGEFHDSVQIFVTRHESGENGGTHHIEMGLGNWFSRYGQVRDWVLRVDAENIEPENR